MGWLNIETESNLYMLPKNSPANTVDYLGLLGPLAALLVAADKALAPIIGCVCGFNTNMMYDAHYAMCESWKNGGSFEDGLEAAVNSVKNQPLREAEEACIVGAGAGIFSALTAPPGAASISTLLGGGIVSIGAMPAGCLHAILRA
ncbi:MAG: hypothetical protein P1U86_22725 [Verrucomicrobiales bacterium]|nr:hypothetical protein [Verrucomicrobiales bacterium]